MILFVVTLLVFVGVVAVLFWVKTPHYRMTEKDVLLLLQKVLVGQASENEWAIFLSTSFRQSPLLESIRSRCALIDDTEFLGHTRAGVMFSETGLAQIRDLMMQLQMACSDQE